MPRVAAARIPPVATNRVARFMRVPFPCASALRTVVAIRFRYGLRWQPEPGLSNGKSNHHPLLPQRLGDRLTRKTHTDRGHCEIGTRYRCTSHGPNASSNAPSVDSSVRSSSRTSTVRRPDTPWIESFAAVFPSRIATANR